MSQKDYKLEVIDKLLLSATHLRGLAKKLNTNQMMISRKIKELEIDNVVDFRQEGKNKVYFLKKTFEAQEHAYFLEHYKSLRIVKKYPLLKNIFIKIKLNPKVNLAVLFGSYAKELAHKESDIDIYIETTSAQLKQEIGQLSTAISVKIGIFDRNNLLIKEIQKNHVVIKGVENYYDKSQFFL
ncbi:nucleotidyltransferase domain-containing protein [Candidatus Woesearchaeota archaeon]|nr:nucleotidyltransferase domain-containing protein [Candidatus Woesearchaeota archaeon]